MGYSGCGSNGLAGFGCGKTCGCSTCRAGTLSEWYVEDDGDDSEPAEPREEPADVSGPPPVTPGYLVARPYSQLAPIYDRALGIPSFTRTRRAFEFAAARYGIRFGSAADIGCGTGLFACYLRRRWRVPVFAVDRSTDMLRIAACRCRTAGIRVLEQDIRDLCLPCPVDLITANFDTVNHLLSARDLLRTFVRIAANLAAGGHFVFDVITDRQMPPRARVHRLRAAGRKLFQEIRWDRSRGLLSITIVHRWPGRTPPSVEFHTERTYAPDVVGRLLLDAGLVVVGVHDATTLGPPGPRPQRLFVVTRKRAAA
jgi:SAM-dependent methyltransferase